MLVGSQSFLSELLVFISGNMCWGERVALAFLISEVFQCFRFGAFILAGLYMNGG